MSTRMGSNIKKSDQSCKYYLAWFRLESNDTLLPELRAGSFDSFSIWWHFCHQREGVNCESNWCSCQQQNWSYCWLTMIATAQKDKINKILQKRKVNTKTIEKNIGRFVNIISPSFPDWLRSLSQWASKWRGVISIPPQCIEGLHLMSHLIRKARDGFNMNIVAYLKSTWVYRFDSCLKSFSECRNQGIDWRFYLLSHLQFHASNNLLECLATSITTWINIINGCLHLEDCWLFMSDSTLLVEWVKISNFNDDLELNEY